jgi:hypothetical protein
MTGKPIFRCQFCKRRLPTETGVRKHIQNTFACRKRWNAAITVHHQAAKEKSFSETVQEWQDEHMDVILSEVADTINRERSPSIEDDLDVDDPEIRRFVERYPGPVGQILGHGESLFAQWERQNTEAHVNDFAPFANKDEWAMAVWLFQNVGHTKIEEFLKLAMVSKWLLRFKHHKLTSKLIGTAL